MICQPSITLNTETLMEIGKVTNEQKAKVSRAYGRSYLVFDRNGNEYNTIRNRLLSHALDDAKECGGEIWLSGKCVVPAWNVY